MLLAESRRRRKGCEICEGKLKRQGSIRRAFLSIVGSAVSYLVVLIFVLCDLVVEKVSWI